MEAAFSVNFLGLHRSDLGEPSFNMDFSKIYIIICSVVGQKCDKSHETTEQIWLPLGFVTSVMAVKAKILSGNVEFMIDDFLRLTNS